MMFVMTRHCCYLNDGACKTEKKNQMTKENDDFVVLSKGTVSQTHWPCVRTKVEQASRLTSTMMMLLTVSLSSFPPFRIVCVNVFGEGEENPSTPDGVRVGFFFV